MVKYFTLSKKLIFLIVYLQKDKDNCDNCKYGDNTLRKATEEVGKGLEQPR